MKIGLADEDIRPAEVLRDAVGGRLALEIGIEPTEEAVIDALEGVDVLFATSRIPVTGRVLRETDLEVVAKIGTGLDNVDLEAAMELGVPVTYTPGINAQSVAEHTLGLVLAVSRKIVTSDRLFSEGYWRDEVELGIGITGKTLGIVGFGDVGSRVAGLTSGFNFDVLAYDPYVLEQDTDITGAELVSLDELLRRSDVVTINAELTEETRGMFDTPEFELMKDSAILVNTARGPIVSEAALVDALEHGRIAGAGLDVFEVEPLPPDSPLHRFDNVVTTPHTGGMTGECRIEMIRTLVSNALGILDNAPIPARFVAVRPDA